MRVNVEAGVRTAASVAWEARPHMSLLYWSYICSVRMNDRQRVSQQRVLQQHPVWQQLVLLALLRSSTRRWESTAGTEATRPSRWNGVSSEYGGGYMCVAWTTRSCTT